MWEEFVEFVESIEFIGFVEFFGSVGFVEFVGLKTYSGVGSRESKRMKEKAACPYFATLHTVYAFLSLTSGTPVQ